MAKKKFLTLAQLQKKLQELPKNLITKKSKIRAGRKMAQLIVEIIRERTLKGVFARRGSSGTKARRYSESYAKRKGKSGRPNLYDTGEMLNSMKGDYSVTDKVILAGIKFTNAQARRKAEIHNDLGSGKSRVKRRFLYLNKRERSKVMSAALSALKKG